MEPHLDQHTNMDLAHSTSSSSSTRSSTPILTNCERLQIANSELLKFSILHANVSHAIEAAAPYAQKTRRSGPRRIAPRQRLPGNNAKQQAVEVDVPLSLVVTPRLSNHSTPVNSPSKSVTLQAVFRNSPKISSKKEGKRDGLYYLLYQTCKIRKIEFKNCEIKNYV
ncbi:hypothetical protein TNIN_497211 [Trichonephila inaurata madagascariensis]|uniref:Uncharacterized protein n=1 Tax=Trichonephila inaurata madagascariensis TaxID=2747483 RepID=A0A8X6WUR2_9ARAC|nr:hypothetical protein TNIN_497211 [Trichonephila inaurata madagascariensis]